MCLYLKCTNTMCKHFGWKSVTYQITCLLGHYKLTDTSWTLFHFSLAREGAELVGNSPAKLLLNRPTLLLSLFFHQWHSVVVLTVIDSCGGSGESGPSVVAAFGLDVWGIGVGDVWGLENKAKVDVGWTAKGHGKFVDSLRSVMLSSVCNL